MLFTTFAVSCMLGAVIAIPSPHHHHDKKLHKYGTFTGTAAAVTGSASGAPYAMNATAGALSTGIYHHKWHGHHDHDHDHDHDHKHKDADATATGTALNATPSPDSADSADDNTAPVVEDKHQVEADTCGPATVTVTSNTVVTVTVSGGGPTAAPSVATAAPSVATAAPSVAPTVGAISLASIPIQSPASSSTGAAAADGTDSAPSSSLSPSAEVAPSSSAPAVQASSSAPSTPPATSPAKSGPGLKTKRGIIASGNAMNAVAAAFGNTKVSWLGNWFSAPPSTIASSLTFVPQNYGRQSDITGEWTKNAIRAVAAGDKYMLSFGEPGTPNDKLYMDPQQGAQLFMDKMQPYTKQGVTIGAPGTLQNTQDFTWLQSFLDTCTQCSIGFIALHWFDKAAGPNQVPGFKDTVAKAAKIAAEKNIPVWVDNIQASGTADEQKAFLQEVVPWLDSQDEVQAYAYVPTDIQTGGAAGMTDGNALNDLGNFYANL